ncbi:MAG: trigger factor [Myxococcota bacterium]
MESQISEISPVLVEVSVQFPWERVRKDLDSNYKQIARTARVKGFRPGKVPEQVVRRLFGRQVHIEVSAQLVEEGLSQAIVQHKIDIVAQPTILPPSIEDGEPLRFVAKCEVRPTVEHLSFENLNVTRTTVTVTDEEVSQQIEQLRERHAEFREPDPMRPSLAGDQLTIDYQVMVDGEMLEELGATGRVVEVGSDELVQQVKEGLVGALPDEEKSFEISFGDDHPSDTLRSKTANFIVQVRELQEKVLPKLDDEFAKDCGEYETLVDLRRDQHRKLEEAGEKNAKSQLRTRIVDALIEANKIELPPSLVESQRRRGREEYLRFSQMMGMTPDAPVSQEVSDSINERAERQVHAALLLGSLAKQTEIVVTDEELEAKFKKMSEESGKHIAKVRAEWSGTRREDLEAIVLEEKLIDFLISKAHIKETAAEESDSGASSYAAEDQAAGDQIGEPSCDETGSESG